MNSGAGGECCHVNSEPVKSAQPSGSMSLHANPIPWTQKLGAHLQDQTGVPAFPHQLQPGPAAAAAFELQTVPGKSLDTLWFDVAVATLIKVQTYTDQLSHVLRSLEQACSAVALVAGLVLILLCSFRALLLVFWEGPHVKLHGPLAVADGHLSLSRGSGIMLHPPPDLEYLRY